MIFNGKNEKQTTNKINTITFTTPIIAKTIRIALYTPLNGNNFSIKSNLWRKKYVLC